MAQRTVAVHPAPIEQQTGASPWRLDTAALRPFETFVLRCGSRALSAAALDELRRAGTALTPDEWEQVAIVAQAHRLAPLLFTHLATAGLLDAAPSEVRERLKSAYVQSLVKNRRMQLDLGKILAAFEARDVEVLIVKGVVLAERYYGDFALRPMADIDLLVRRPQLARCLDGLRAVGYLPVAGRGRRLDFNVLSTLELRYQHPDGLCVEPHLELARLPAYRAGLAVADVWRRAEVVTVEGRTTRYLAPRDELRYLCMHYAVQHRAEGRWLWLVDIAEFLRAHAATWDWADFAAETITLGIATPILVALAHARALLQLDVPAAVGDRLEAAAATAREREAWRLAYASFADAGRFTRHLIGLQGATERAAFVLGAAAAGVPFVGRRLQRVRHHLFPSR